jgi:hypothetical protein
VKATSVLIDEIPVLLEHTKLCESVRTSVQSGGLSVPKVIIGPASTSDLVESPSTQSGETTKNIDTRVRRARLNDC